MAGNGCITTVAVVVTGLEPVRCLREKVNRNLRVRGDPLGRICQGHGAVVHRG